MKNSRNGFSSKIIIYQMPMFERILALFSAIFLSVIPCLYLFIPLFGNTKELFLGITGLIAVLAYDIYTYFCVFKTYICFDVCGKELVIREFLQTEEVVRLEDVTCLAVTLDPKYHNIFSLDINHRSYTQKITSWSTHPSCRLALFRVNERQVKRLRDFAYKCNQHLNVTTS